MGVNKPLTLSLSLLQIWIRILFVCVPINLDPKRPGLGLNLALDPGLGSNLALDPCLGSNLPLDPFLDFVEMIRIQTIYGT